MMREELVSLLSPASASLICPNTLLEQTSKLEHDTPGACGAQVA